MTAAEQQRFQVRLGQRTVFTCLPPHLTQNCLRGGPSRSVDRDRCLVLHAAVGMLAGAVLIG